MQVDLFISFYVTKLMFSVFVHSYDVRGPHPHGYIVLFDFHF